MRRVSTGKVGAPIVGNLLTTANTLTSVKTNEDINIDPNGTGSTNVTGSIRMVNESQIEFGDSDNSNWVALKAPATVASNQVYTLPDPATITNGHILQVNGSGVLSFVDTNIEVTNQPSSGSVFNLAFTDSSGTNITGLNVTNGVCTFQPSSGTLSATALSAGSASITNSVGCDTLTATTSIQSASITETSSIVLKENITPLSQSLEKLVQMTPVQYTRKSTGAFETGLIAEEVEEIAPELVNNQGKYKSINYTRLSAYLIDAVKDLKQELDFLKKQGEIDG